MKAAKCRLCGEEHYGLCPSLKGEVISRTPATKNPPKKSTDQILEESASLGKSLAQKAEGILRSLPGCPVCEARRKVKALQMKRYREKKNA